MKGSQVAGLTAGWLTIALSMAAIGSASVARVGVDNAESQPQVTVTRTIAVEKPVPTPIAATDIAAAITAPAQVTAVSIGQYTKPVATARASALASAQTAPASPPTSPTTPSGGPWSGTPGDTPASPPPIVTVPKPTPSPTTDPSEGGGSPSGTPGVPPSFGVWRHAPGVIWAGCAGSALTFLDARPNYGYTVTQRTSPLRATVTFSGPTKVSVRISCTFGQPSFDTTH